MIEYVAIQYDESLGYREHIIEECFNDVEDAITFVKNQAESKYPWVIEVNH